MPSNNQITRAMLQRYLLGILAGSVLLLVFASGASAQRNADHEEIIEQKFTVRSGETLLLTAERGSVEVIGDAASNEAFVRIRKQVDGLSDREAQELLDRYTVDFSQSGGGLEITGEMEGRTRGRNRLRIAYEVHVPRDFDVQIATAGGSVRVAELDGTARMRTSGGSISVSGVQGLVEAVTSGGSISADGIGGEATLRTSGGSINATEIGGPVVAKTSGGSITLAAINGRVSASTSGGSIRATDIEGEIDASTSGGSILATMDRQPESPMSLQTSGGSVSLDVIRDARMNLDAHASGGRVHTDLPIAGRIENSRIRGEINGGGPLVSLRTSGGNVNIRTH